MPKMVFWKAMAQRAWREALKAVGLETTERVVVLLLTQVAISVGLFVWVTDPASGLLVRVLTAAAPFFLFPFLFAWKWIALPPALAREADASSSGKIANPHDKTLAEAIGFAVHGVWGRAATEDGLLVPTFHALEELEQFLANDLMGCWGQANRNYGPHLRVPAEHWQFHRFPSGR